VDGFLVRFDLQSAVVMGTATLSSLTVAWWFTHREPRLAEAAVPAPAHAASLTAPASGQAAQIARSPDGHYWAQADIEGRAVRMLVDTGASLVALTREDALRLGLRLTPADFTQTVETASGPVMAAAIELDHLGRCILRVSEREAVDILICHW
jgi:aspartyl protease family protein